MCSQFVNFMVFHVRFSRTEVNMGQLVKDSLYNPILYFRSGLTHVKRDKANRLSLTIYYI